MATNLVSDDVLASILQNEEEQAAQRPRFSRLGASFRYSNQPATRPNLRANLRGNLDDDVILLDNEHRTNNFSRQSSKKAVNNQNSQSNTNPDTDSDEMVARLLQEKYDKEYAQSLRLESPMSARPSISIGTASAFERHQQPRIFPHVKSRPPLRISTTSTLDLIPPDSNQNTTTDDSTLPTTSSSSSSRVMPRRPLNSRTSATTTDDRTDSRMIPSFQTDMLNMIARSSNSRTDDNPRDESTAMQNSDSLPRTSRSRANDPVTNLANAFSILTNDNLMNNYMNDLMRDDGERVSNAQAFFDIPMRTGTYELPEMSQRMNFPAPMPRRARNAHTQFTPHFRVGPLGISTMNGNRDFTPNDYESLLRLDEINGVKKTLSKSELESLPCFSYKLPSASSQSDNSHQVCSICYDEFVQNDKISALSCSHKFHHKCIQQWLKVSRRCPLCQKDAITGE